MSSVKHHAIIVTASYDASYSLGNRVPAGVHWAEYARQKALEIFGNGQVSEIIDPRLNNVRSFLVGPDGSNDEREESDQGDRRRHEFVQWLREQSYGINEDGEYEGTPLTWVEVQYGDEMDLETRVVADSDEQARGFYAKEDA